MRKDKYEISLENERNHLGKEQNSSEITCGLSCEVIFVLGLSW